MEKQYAIIRIKSICNRTVLGQANAHGKRTDISAHVDRERTHLNQFWVPSLGLEDPQDLIAAVDRVTEVLGARRRSDSAGLLADFHVGASPEFFLYDDGQEGFDPVKIERWTRHNIEVFNRKFPGQVAQVRLDLDEQTPHLAVFVVPTYEKTTKRGITSLWVSYRKQFGGNREEASAKCTALQDWYAAEMACFGLHRGEPKAETGRKHKHHNVYRQEEARKSRETQAALDAAVEANEVAQEDRERAASTLVEALEDRERLLRDKEQLERATACSRDELDRDRAKLAAENKRLEQERNALEAARARQVQEEALLLVEQGSLQRARTAFDDDKRQNASTWRKMVAGLTRAAEMIANDQIQRNEKGAYVISSDAKEQLLPVWKWVKPIFELVQRKLDELNRARREADAERTQLQRQREIILAESAATQLSIAAQVDEIQTIHSELAALRRDMSPAQLRRLEDVESTMSGPV